MYISSYLFIHFLKSFWEFVSLPVAAILYETFTKFERYDWDDLT